MNAQIKFSHAWAMPSRHTFSIPPIGDFVKRYLDNSKSSIDPFCGEKQWATFNNDLAHGGVDAEQFLKSRAAEGYKCDLLLFDPPYSPRQMSECYKSVGLEVGMTGTQNGALYKRVRDAAMPLLTDDAVVLSFGWNTAGMGSKRGFEKIEILICDHGGGHNATLCLAERRISKGAA